MEMNIDVNLTEQESLERKKCSILLETEPSLPEGYCRKSYDGILCWPDSPPNYTAYLPCMDELYGIKYDSSQNASRFCYENGTWANYSDYDSCMDIVKVHEPKGEEGVIVLSMIYSVGYGVSLVALCIAVWIFIYFRDLRCLRNTIHTNLMCTYIFADAMWFLNYIIQVHVPNNGTAVCIPFILLHYLVLTNYFWMFVEGLYLYMLIVETFTRENITLRAYLAIGWGTPMIVIIIWGLARVFTPNDFDQVTVGGDHIQCTWVAPNSSDWIYKAAAITVLAVNVIFLAMIMWVLITKLRSSNNVETQQYRKATKALLVLIPLLGVTFILFLVGPSDAEVFLYARAVLLSTQGLMVALFYCFLNTEVQNTVRHHVSRWKENRNLGARRYTFSKDWSPNTRTESIRLYSKHEVAPYKKRESTTSENTTTTLVGGIATNSRLSNGSAGHGNNRGPVTQFLEPPKENAL